MRRYLSFRNIIFYQDPPAPSPQENKDILLNHIGHMKTRDVTCGECTEWENLNLGLRKLTLPSHISNARSNLLFFKCILKNYRIHKEIFHDT